MTVHHQIDSKSQALTLVNKVGESHFSGMDGYTRHTIGGALVRILKAQLQVIQACCDQRGQLFLIQPYS